MRGCVSRYDLPVLTERPVLHIHVVALIQVRGTAWELTRSDIKSEARTFPYLLCSSTNHTCSHLQAKIFHHKVK